jgi:hypothetical protein
MRLRIIRKVAAVSTAIHGFLILAVDVDCESNLVAPFPLRADGMGLAFADLLAEAADEDRGSYATHTGYDRATGSLKGER